MAATVVVMTVRTNLYINFCIKQALKYQGACFFMTWFKEIKNKYIKNLNFLR
jgi:enoyl-[acyl-carrier-protein] reductase (NADH)